MMRHLTILTAALIAATTPALAQEAGPAAVMRDADAALSCAQLSEEAASLSATMGEQPGGSMLGRLGGVARAGAAMVIPGVGLASAAADAATAPERERREAEARASENRWYYLNGLYAGQRCQQAAEAAAAPAAQPSPSTAIPVQIPRS